MSVLCVFNYDVINDIMEVKKRILGNLLFLSNSIFSNLTFLMLFMINDLGFSSSKAWEIRISYHPISYLILSFVSIEPVHKYDLLDIILILERKKCIDDNDFFYIN